MKTLLLCPGSRPAVAALAERAPLAALPLLGEPVIAHWLAYLAGRGARRVTIVAADRVDDIRQIVGDGARWGLTAEVIAVAAEPAPDEARASLGGSAGEPSLSAPPDVVLADHLPGRPDLPLFGDYRQWFTAVQVAMASPLSPDRVGWREIRPGVIAGLHCRISPDARLEPPCWIGEGVYLGSGVTIGPRAVIEDHAMIEPGAEVADSIVGPETFVGRQTEVRDSLAWGDQLVEWRTGARLRVADAFLLCPLREPSAEARTWRLADLWRSAAAEAGRPALPPDADLNQALPSKQ